MSHLLTSALSFSPSHDALYRGSSRFDPWALAWCSVAEADIPDDRTVMPDAAAAHRRLSQSAALRRRVPVGVIGPKNASPDQRSVAEAIGRHLAQAGFQLMTGGRGGVMEAASKGAWEAGGQPIGIIPDEEWSAANAYVAIPIATGLGPARNAIIARACEVLIAIGGEYGTLSEMAFGMHFGRLVLTLENAPAVAGTVCCDGIEDAIERTARRMLRLE